MAQNTERFITAPVNSGTAIAALNAANRAVHASLDATTRMLAMRRDLETLRAERDQARFRINDLERETRELHESLSRATGSVGGLRGRGRWLVKSLAVLASFTAAFVATGSGTPAPKAPATDAIYVCEVEG